MGVAARRDCQQDSPSRLGLRRKQMEGRRRPAGAWGKELLLLGTKRLEPMCTVVDVSKGGDLKLLGKGCDS